MRKSFISTLQALDEDIIKMATLAGLALDKAINSLTTENIELARQVEQDDDIIDKMQLVIDKHCLEALIRQQPLAKDMRVVLAILKMTGELERIGDQAADIAHLVKRLIKRNYKQYNYENILRMCHITKGMLNDLIRSFVEKDLELAIHISEMDNKIDALYSIVIKEIRAMMTTAPQYIDEGITFLSIAKYIERIGDHITNVSEWIIYTKTARFAKERKYDEDHLDE